MMKVRNADSEFYNEVIIGPMAFNPVDYLQRSLVQEESKIGRS